jgi:PAS domain S-box-containing protein
MVMELNEVEQPERSLRESPNALADIIESAMDAIIAVDDAQRIVLFNVAAEKMFCCPADEAMGSSIERFIPQRFRAGHSTHVRQFDKSGVTNRTLSGPGTLWGLRATGEEFPIEASISKVESAGKKFFTAVIRDITERKRSEEAWFRHASIVESSEDAIISKNLDGVITSWNAGAEQIFGYTEPEAVGQPITILIPRELLDEENNLLERLRVGERIKHYETIRVTKAGKKITVSLSISPLKDSTGRIVGGSKIARDITERKRAQETLRKSEERFRLAAQAGRMFAYEWDAATDKVVRSGDCTEVLGIAETAPFTGEQIFANVHPDDREKLTSTIAQLSTQKPYLQIRYRMLRPDGGVIWVERNSQAYFDDQGSLLRIAGMVTNITERKRAEDDVKESEQRFRLAAQVGKMYSYDWDVTTDVLVRSPEYVKILGDTEPVRFVRPQFLDKIHPDDLPRFVAAIAGLNTENPIGTVTYRVLLPGGATVWLKNSGRAFFDAEGRMLRVIGMVADVTDQKLAEESLRTSGERLRLAQQAARIGTFDWNIRTDVNTWTPELEAIYGLPPGGFGGTHAAFEAMVHPDDRAMLRKLVDATLTTREVTQGEWRVVWPDGSIHWIAGRWQLFMDESGEPSRVLGVNADVTERKLAEHALADITRKVIAAQEQERSRIGRELHDDINQRLAMLAVDLAQLQEDPSDVQRRLQDIREEMAEVSNDVQALSHDLHSSKLEYLGVVAGMKGWCQEFAERQGLEIDFSSDVSDVLPLEIGVSLFRVIQEALNNAGKHSGVTRFEVQLLEKSKELHLIISDSGRGFDVEAARQRHGLGLTSMRERVRMVNGTITIESKPMGGTTIRVRVPLGSEPKAV